MDKSDAPMPVIVGPTNLPMYFVSIPTVDVPDVKDNNDQDMCEPVKK